MQKLLKRAKNEIKTDEDLIVLSIAASLLASFGVYLNDVFILIGSMLVAPFFDPMIAFAVFLIRKKFRNAIRAAIAFIAVTTLSLAASMILFMILNPLGNLADAEYILPYNDLNFFVSILLGIIGALLWIWPKTSNTSAGISVAISLVPPLANIGRWLVLGNGDKALFSARVFFVNTAGIIIGAFLILLIKNFSNKKQLN